MEKLTSMKYGTPSIRIYPGSSGYLNLQTCMMGANDRRDRLVHPHHLLSRNTKSRHLPCNICSRAGAGNTLSCVHNIPVNIVTDLRAKRPRGSKIDMSPDFFFEVLRKFNEIKEIRSFFKIDKDVNIAVSPASFRANEPNTPILRTLYRAVRSSFRDMSRSRISSRVIVNILMFLSGVPHNNHFPYENLFIL